GRARGGVLLELRVALRQVDGGVRRRAHRAVRGSDGPHKTKRLDDEVADDQQTRHSDPTAGRTDGSTRPPLPSTRQPPARPHRPAPPRYPPAVRVIGLVCVRPGYARTHLWCTM